MVWEVLSKERAKAITNYTKLKLYYSHTRSNTQKLVLLLALVTKILF